MSSPASAAAFICCRFPTVARETNKTNLFLRPFQLWHSFGSVIPKSDYNCLWLLVTIQNALVTSTPASCVGYSRPMQSPLKSKSTAAREASLHELTWSVSFCVLCSPYCSRDWRCVPLAPLRSVVLSAPTTVILPSTPFMHLLHFVFIKPSVSPCSLTDSSF